MLSVSAGVCVGVGVTVGDGVGVGVSETEGDGVAVPMKCVSWASPVHPASRITAAVATMEVAIIFFILQIYVAADILRRPIDLRAGRC